MKTNELALKVNKFGQGTWIDQFSLVLSSIYFLVPLYLLVNILVFILAGPKRFFIILAMFLALVIHTVVHEGIIKRLFRKIFFIPRPYVADPRIKPIGQKHSDSSFPSGHMSSLTAVSVVIVLFFPYLWPLIVVFLVLVGFSRIHNGYHYLIDVICGPLFGIVYACLALWMISNF